MQSVLKLTLSVSRQPMLRRHPLARCNEIQQPQCLPSCADDQSLESNGQSLFVFHCSFLHLGWSEMESQGLAQRATEKLRIAVGLMGLILLSLTLRLHNRASHNCLLADIDVRSVSGPLKLKRIPNYSSDILASLMSSTFLNRQLSFHALKQQDKREIGKDFSQGLKYTGKLTSVVFSKKSNFLAYVAKNP